MMAATDTKAYAAIVTKHTLYWTRGLIKGLAKSGITTDTEELPTA